MRRAMPRSAEARLVRLSPRQRVRRSLTTGAPASPGAVGWQRATGIDSFGAPGGDKDGYRNLSGRLRGDARARPERSARRRGFRADRAERSSTATTRSPSSIPIRSTTAATGSRRAASGPSSGATNRHGADVSARRCSARPTAIFLAERSGQPDPRNAADARCAARAPLRDRRRSSTG